MATEEYYRLAEDPFISRKSELTALKDKLASQLVSLIEVCFLPEFISIIQVFPLAINLCLFLNNIYWKRPI